MVLVVVVQRSRPSIFFTFFVQSGTKIQTSGENDLSIIKLFKYILETNKPFLSHHHRPIHSSSPFISYFLVCHITIRSGCLFFVVATQTDVVNKKYCVSTFLLTANNWQVFFLRLHFHKHHHVD